MLISIIINNNTSGVYLFWYERVYFFLPSALPWWYQERDTNHKGYAKHTMLIAPSPREAHLVVSKISTHLYQSRPKLIWSDQIRKTPTARFEGQTSTPFYSKSENSLAISSGYDIIHPLNSLQLLVPPHLLSKGGLSWQMMIVISFPRGHASATSDYDTRIKRHRVVQSLTKLDKK